MTDKATTQVRNAVSTYFTPILLAIIGFVFQQQFSEIKSDLKELRRGNEEKMEIIIELRQRMQDIERRIGTLEDQKTSRLYKHEEIFYLKPKITIA